MQAALSTLFIVWRESVEALLIIGILYAWLKQNNMQAQIRHLWIGSSLGIALAFGLAVLFFLAGQWFSGANSDWFFACMILVASLLIMQMVVWMHRCGRGIKQELEQEAARSFSTAGGFGIILIAMIAVAREGSETVIFLAGIGAQYQGTSLALFSLSGLAGFVLATISFILLYKTASAISWKWYFRISKYILLLIGGAMIVSAADKITDQLSNYNLPDWLFAFIGDPLWNSQWLLPDNSVFSSMLASLTGYRAQPSLMEIMVLIGYWAAAFWLTNRPSSAKPEPLRKAIKT